MNLIPNVIENKYDIIWKSLIRPPRDLYEMSELGKEKFKINDLNFKRTDFTIMNKQKLKLECSIWEPFAEERKLPRLPLVIYLPGNSSSRCEARALISYLLPMNIQLLSFDFSGSGHSEGEYISLGYYEKEDVISVIEYIKQTNKVSKIGLWGRSMGAVTSLLAAYEYNNTDTISCIVVDSGFTSLSKLIDDYVKDTLPLLPQFMINYVKNITSQIILKKAHFTIDQINPVELIKNIEKTSALFCHALNDHFISNEHCKILYENYNGPKEIVMFDGNHNSKRPVHILQMISLFFYEKLDIENIESLSMEYDNNTNNIIKTTNSKNVETLHENYKSNEREDKNNGEDDNDEDDDDENVEEEYMLYTKKTVNTFQSC